MLVTKTQVDNETEPAHCLVYVCIPPSLLDTHLSISLAIIIILVPLDEAQVTEFAIKLHVLVFPSRTTLIIAVVVGVVVALLIVIVVVVIIISVVVYCRRTGIFTPVSLHPTLHVTRITPAH